MQEDQDYRRFFIAALLAALVMTVWMAKVEAPRRAALAQLMVAQEKHEAARREETQKAAAAKAVDADDNPLLSRAQRLAGSPRIAISSDKLSGSIALKGARFDDLALVKYREDLAPDSPEVTLFSPGGDENAYVAQVGWLATDGKTRVPDQNTLWQADRQTLRPGDTVHLHWDNGAGVTYLLALALDNDYMFSIGQRVENHGAGAIGVAPYAYINRAVGAAQQAPTGLHEGPLGVFGGALTEVTYKELLEKGDKNYDTGAASWFGITDKYWLAALIPGGGVTKATFSHYAKNDKDRYQVDYLGEAATVGAGQDAENQVRLFAGAKELKLLDRYAAGDAAHGQPPVLLFDRAIDFGVLYFLAKPMAQLLNFFFALSGNFGIAIMMLTVVIKSLMYPLASKSYKASSRIQELQPELQKLQERYAEDKLRLNQEKMALFKREKVNPASGCLPAFIQMPVFFALLKVLNVSIEMRHAPFFGWIRDLSASDPSNIFTLFGLIPWEPYGWMHLGLLPILYCITMILYMRQQPKPADPTSAKTMKIMPYFLLFVFAKMPAGLVLYWIWSNTISIFQQLIITSRHSAAKLARQKIAAS